MAKIPSHYSLKSKNKFRYKGDYKSHPNNLDGEREDLYEVFFDELNKRRTFHLGQKEIFKAFFEDKYKYLFNRTGRKGAKTTTNIILAWGFCLDKPRRTCYITLPTIELALEIYWDEKRLQWCDLDNTDLNELFVRYTDASKRTITFINDSTIKLIGTWSEARGRGTQPNLLIVDEVKDCSADYLDAMEPNLAAKSDSTCVMSGTPPNKRTHYHEWEDRIIKNPEGKNFIYSSYINTALPHLKSWLDNKHVELVEAGKEDVWLREYMAIDCFSSDERVLPDIKVEDHDEILNKLRIKDSSTLKPFIGITITKDSLSYCYGIMTKSKYYGMKMWVLETKTKVRLWDKTYESIYKEIENVANNYSVYFKNKCNKLVYDETKSFTDVIPNIIESRKDLKWKDRGIPLLKEMILENKMIFTTGADQFAVEAQNILKEENLLEYPVVCTMAMIVNEYYQAPYIPKNEKEIWNKLIPIRESGIICYPTKKNSKQWFKFNKD